MDFKEAVAGNIEVKVCNLLGKEIVRLDIEEAKEKYLVDLNSIEAGPYIPVLN